MESKLQDLLQCPVCLGQLKQPRILPCFHSFCESCLDTHIQTSSQGHQSYFSCPSCRVDTIVPYNSAQGFPRDFRLITFMDVLNSVVGSKNTSVCDVCSLESNFEIAVSFCAECKKYFCNTCTTSHKQKPYLVAHLLINLQCTETSNEIQEKCETHVKEDVQYVCRTCDLELCVVCILKDHEGHSILQLETESLITKRCLTTAFKNVHKKIWKIHEEMFNLTCLDGRLKGHYAESKTLIQKRSRKLVQRILGEEKKFLRELDKDFFQKRQEIDQLKDLYRSNLKEFEIYQSQLKCLMTSEQTDSKIPKDILGQIKSMNSQIQISHPESLKTVKKFQPGKLFEMGTFSYIKMDDGDISDFSTSNDSGIENSMSLPNLSELENIPISRTLEPRILPKLPNTKYVLKVQLISKFGGKENPTNQLSLPYNICFSRNDEIIVAENGAQRVQILDKYGHPVKMIQNDSIIPRGVTLLNSDNIAVTDESSRGVNIFNMAGTLEREFTPECMTLPYGIAAMLNGDFVFTDMIFETVSIVKQNGELRYQFGGHGCSDNNFDNPGYLLVDFRDRIFVSDSGNHCIKVFTKHGHFLFKFGEYGTGHGKFRYPKGLAIDKSGNIFVVDSGNDRVLMFSREGTYLGIVLDKSHNLCRPTGLAVSSTNLLAVSMPDSGEIYVFAIST